MEIRQVQTKTEIAEVARLARTIWEEHFTPIIGPEQVAYMLDRFQSEAAIASQIENGFHYFAALEAGEAVGYGAVKPEGNTAFLSKLYVRRDRRGQGTGRAMLDYVESLALEHGAERIRLTVNRHNRIAIDAYLRWGFAITDEQVADIGGGFVMDDYVMERVVGGS